MENLTSLYYKPVCHEWAGFPLKHYRENSTIKKCLLWLLINCYD